MDMQSRMYKNSLLDNAYMSVYNYTANYNEMF